MAASIPQIVECGSFLWYDPLEISVLVHCELYFSSVPSLSLRCDWTTDPNGLSFFCFYLELMSFHELKSQPCEMFTFI